MAAGISRGIPAGAADRDCKSDAAVIGARCRRARGARRRSGRRATPQPPRLAQALSHRQRVRRAGARNSNWRRALASPTCRSTATARWRSNRRSAAIFRHAVHWSGAVSVDNPLALTRAYAARFAALGGLALTGDARTLHRSNPYWRVETASGPVDAGDVVIALGPWTPDVLSPSASNCRLRSSAAITAISAPRETPCLAARCSMPRTAFCWRRWSRGSASLPAWSSRPATRRRRRCSSAALMPAARELFPLGDPVEAEPWLGARPCFADSRPVISRAPGQRGLWLAFGHGHWGLTLSRGYRPAHCRNDDRRGAVLRSKAVRRGTICALTVGTLRSEPTASEQPYEFMNYGFRFRPFGPPE